MLTTTIQEDYEEYIDLIVGRGRALEQQLKRVDAAYQKMATATEATRQERNEVGRRLKAIEELLRAEGAFDRLYPVQE